MHTFRKYISNRGSALFMVISTMTALMITCMAMYFTVLASRSTTYTIFNQKQAYQSAASIFGMLANGSSDSLTVDQALLSVLLDEDIKPGDELPEITGSDENLGDYSVSVRRNDNETEGGVEYRVFDIVVSATVDGVVESYHSVVRFPDQVSQETPAADPNVSLSPTFAATGYVPNDVYLDKGMFYSDTFFDNEVTYFSLNGGAQMQIYGDVNCAGSVVFGAGFQWNNRNGEDSKRPITVAIRNNLTATHGNNTPFKSGDRFLIGGNLELSDFLKNAYVYVNGDLHIVGGDAQHNETHFFVNGDVYTDLDGMKVWCNGNSYRKDGSPRSSSFPTWDSVAGTNIDGFEVLPYNDMILELDKRTQTTPYYKWTLDEDEIPEVSLDEDKGNHQIININEYGKPYYIVHEDAYNSTNNPYGDDAALDAQWKKGCVIDDINVSTGHFFFIIIDTGDNPDNVYTIRLHENTDGVKGHCYFTWNGGGNERPIVLVKGKGSVVIDVPPKVIYQEVEGGMTCHYNWWILNDKTVLNIGGYPYDAPSEGLRTDIMKKFVHSTCGTNCTEGCQSAIAEPVDSTETCTRDTHPNGVSKTKKTVKCGVHGIEVTYCPYCEEFMVKDPNGAWCFCKDHVDKGAIDAVKDGYMDRLNLATDGSMIYPNCNIYLISSDESSEFRFAKNSWDTQGLGYNGMVGYVYAPYQTFGASSGAGGMFLKFMGGMTVSDHNFKSDGAFIMCMPDKNPADLMPEEAKKHQYKVSKDWKIQLVTH